MFDWNSLYLREVTHVHEDVNSTEHPTGDQADGNDVDAEEKFLFFRFHTREMYNS